MRQPSKVASDNGKLIGQLMSERIHGVGNIMPPTTMPPLSAQELSILDNWLTQGAPAGQCTGTGTGSGGASGIGGSTSGSSGGAWGSSGATSANSGGVYSGGGGAGGSFVGAGGGGGGDVVGAGGAPFVPPGPNDCDAVEIRARKDESGAAFPVPVGTSELYQCFSYHLTPGATNQAIYFKPLMDNPKVVHHWLLYKMSTPQTNGVTSPCLGTHLDGQLLAGWAPGNGPWMLPDDVGVDLGSGDFLIELHYNNYEDTDQTDRSGVEVCRAKVARKNTATLSWLGNDTFGFATAGIPPFTKDAPIVGACRPNITQPITILKSWPHMHKLGRRMEAQIHRANGQVETLFDKQFDFNSQVQYDTPTVLNPGDWIQTTCHYENNGASQVGFGEFTTQEMCYNFTLAYPPNALIAGIGVHSNVCLGQ
jgi:hypothetical protein